MRNNLWIGSGISGMGGIPMLGTGARGLTYLIREIFRNGGQGFAYDPNDLNTLYQDAAGTIPVTAAGQPVGLMLDKSKGLALGVEKSSYVSGFSSLTDINAVGVSTSLVDGALVATSISTDGNDRAEIPITNLVVGRIYTVEVVVKGNQINNQVIYSWTVGSVPVTSIKSTDYTKHKFSFIATAESGVARVYAGAGVGDAGGVIQVKSLSIKELKGNHAYQTVSASRPILQQTPIFGSDITDNGDFNSALSAWASTDGGWSANGGIATSSGTVNGLSYLFNINSLAVGDTAKIIIKIANKGSKGSLGVSFADGGTDTKKWAVAEMAGLTELSWVAKSTTISRIYITTRDGWDGSIDKVEIRKVTGYREDQNYLEFDGADDFLQTSNIDFTGTDEISIFSGLTKLRDDGSAILVELSASTLANNGSFHVEAPSGSNSKNYGAASRGTVRQLAQAESNYAAPNSAVINTKAKISSDTLSLSVNGILATTTNYDQGAGNYGNYPLYIGRRGGISLPFGGHVYGLISVGKLTSDKETVGIEKELAKRVGVTLNV